MSWIDCTKEEQEIIRKCLEAVLNGPFLPDWEFSTLMGVEREELNKVINQWDLINKENDEIKSIISNTIGILTSYPHGYENLLEKYIPILANSKFLEDILNKLYH